MSDLDKSIENVRKPWVASEYYVNAEKWTYLFWDKETPFRRLFEKLPKRNAIELACGHGHHAEISAEFFQTLTIVDVIEDNLAVCRTRLRHQSNVIARLGNGSGFPIAEENLVDSIYCYDAMVHFSPGIVDSYLRDTSRVLCSGGAALYHHSNYAAGKSKNWGLNPHARNYMTRDLFAEMARGHGLEVSDQILINWGGVLELDCLSLVRKP